MTDDLHTYARPSDRILFFSGFPAGYLMWPYRMAANTVWITNADGVVTVLEQNSPQGSAVHRTTLYSPFGPGWKASCPGCQVMFSPLSG